MEHKHKLLATAIGDCTDSRIDRLSTLPDDIVHHILSFLDLRDLAQVGCASTRCRKFYLSTPSLNFDVRHYEGYKWQWRRLKLLNYFDRLLMQRVDNKIQSFRIQWVYVGKTRNRFIEQNYRIITWIKNAVRCNVEVLDLELYKDGEQLYSHFEEFYIDGDDDEEFNTNGIPTLTLPSCTFVCQSLRSLRVVLAGNIFKAPSFACCTNLQCLKLKDCTIDEGFCKSISGSCKCMKELCLERVSGITNMSIESSSLESFCFVSANSSRPHQTDCHLNISCEKLENLYIDWYNTSPGRDLLSIFVPNLKYLYWIGDIGMKYRHFEKLMCLEKAEIHVYPWKEDYDKVFEVLCSMPKVKSLILNGLTVKALFREGSMPTPILDGIWYFGVDIGSLEDDLVPPMVHLLRGMPNLNTLYVRTSKSPCGYDPPPNVSRFDGIYWKSQNLPFIHHLKEVTIELSDEAVHNELELALYLLEHAEHLKKMVILYSLGQSIALWSVLRKMSSFGKVVLQQR